MIVQVEIRIQTEDYGKEEFRKEIEKLVAEIDPAANVISFDMYEIVKEW